MIDIFTILDLNRDMFSPPERNPPLLRNSVKKQLEYYNTRLQRIVEETENLDIPPAPSLEEVIDEFYKYSDNPIIQRELFDTRRQCRQLSWGLSYQHPKYGSIINSIHFDTALNLIKRRLSFSVVRVLFFQFLDQWKSLTDSQRSSLSNIISNYISDSNSNRKLYDAIEQFLETVESSDPIKSITEDLLFEKAEGPNKFSQAYNLPKGYQKVSFLESVTDVFIDEVFKAGEFEQYYNSIKSYLSDRDILENRRYFLSGIILKIDTENCYTSLTKEVKELTNKWVGDPFIESNWVTDIPGREERYREAANILRKWLANEFLTAFFNELDFRDYEREIFWKKHISKVQNFRIFGDDDLRHKLKRVKEIRDLVDSRTGRIKGASVIVLLLETNDYVVIEFSETGNAGYLYKKSGNINYPTANKKIVTIDDLKLTKNTRLYKKSGDNIYNVVEQGKFDHRDDWQQSLTMWMKQTGFN